MSEIWSNEAEQALLGAAILSRRALRHITLALEPGWLYSPAHVAIFNAARNLYQQDREVDFVSLSAVLRDWGVLEDVGGIPYLISLAEILPSASGYQTYLDLIRDLWVRRTLLQRASSLASATPDESTEVLLAQALGLTKGLSFAGRDTYDISEVGLPEATRGLLTGLPTLDLMTTHRGLPRSGMTIVAAPQKTGKTALLTQMALQAARDRCHVAICTYEMSKEQLKARLVKQATGFSGPPSDPTSRANYEAELAWLDAADITIFDPTAREQAYDIESLVAWSVDRHEAQPLDMILVDYAQLLSSRAVSGDNRVRELEHVSRGLVWMAKRTGAAVVVGSQVTLMEDGKGYRTKDSRRFEEDAALVLHLSKQELNVIYNRFGPSGRIALTWEPTQLTFKDGGPQ
jgi:replicative DNA helicase